MSKERARRRAAREHEAALRTAARASAQERRERQLARRRTLRAATTDRVRLASAGRQTGSLARRQQRRTSMLVALLACVNVFVWVVRPEWSARLGALVVTVLAFPVLRILLFSRR
jgi:Flp pilus assembly protein TadB